jgi:hypothetical protein
MLYSNLLRLAALGLLSWFAAMAYELHGQLGMYLAFFGPLVVGALIIKDGNGPKK